MFPVYFNTLLHSVIKKKKDASNFPTYAAVQAGDKKCNRIGAGVGGAGVGGAEWALGVWPSGLERSVAQHMLDKGQVFTPQFTCFASTKVQILTPEEARGQRASEGDGAARWLERALVGLEEEAAQASSTFPAASASHACVSGISVRVEPLTDPLCSRSRLKKQIPQKTKRLF